MGLVSAVTLRVRLPVPASGCSAQWEIVEVRVTLPSRKTLTAGGRTEREGFPFHLVQLLLSIGRRLRILAADRLLHIAGRKAVHESQQAGSRDGGE